MMSGNQVAKRCHVLANSKFLAVLRVPKDVFLAVAEERGESETALVCDPRIFMSVLQLELPREVRLGHRGGCENTSGLRSIVGAEKL